MILVAGVEKRQLTAFATGWQREWLSRADLCAGGAVDLGRARAVHHIHPSQRPVGVNLEEHLRKASGCDIDDGCAVQMHQNLTGIVGPIGIPRPAPARPRTTAARGERIHPLAAIGGQRGFDLLRGKL